MIFSWRLFMFGGKQMKKFEHKKNMILGSIIIAVIVILTIAFMQVNSDGNKINRLLDLGQKYLENSEYEEAITVFDQVIAIEPKCEQAYIGKAQAQYSLGEYENAIDTLTAGISMVDDSTALEEFLQKILDELSEGNGQEEETVSVEAEEAGEESVPLLLNYTSITRSINTEEPVIQLEVIGGSPEEKYTWESTNQECASVSETGTVTCLPTAGYSSIIVKGSKGRQDKCLVHIFDSSQSNENESKTVRIPMEDREEEYFQISLFEEEGHEKAKVVNPFLPNYVYYSGDIIIPNQLNYNGEEIQITGISGSAFAWCNTMKSISIPESVENPANNEHPGSPFIHCLELEKINVDENNAFLKSVDGVLYSKDGKELISYPAARSGNSYTIPKEVEKVWGGAFTGCKNLEEIQVEDGNKNYESIDGVLVHKGWEWAIEAYPIGKKASRYVIPENITAIYGDAFYMSELEEVNFGNVGIISSECFGQCSKLKKIEGGPATQSIAISMKQLNSSEGIAIVGIGTMENLEYLSLTIFEGCNVDDIIDTEEVKKLEKLETYEVNVERKGS